jgi:hypothetical protein
MAKCLCHLYVLVPIFKLVRYTHYQLPVKRMRSELGMAVYFYNPSYSGRDRKI